MREKSIYTVEERGELWGSDPEGFGGGSALPVLATLPKRVWYRGFTKIELPITRCNEYPCHLVRGRSILAEMRVSPFLGQAVQSDLPRW